MKKLTLRALSIVILIIGMAGCASTPVPTAASLQNVPFFDYGETPDGDNHIMENRGQIYYFSNSAGCNPAVR